MYTECYAHVDDMGIYVQQGQLHRTPSEKENG
jgi:hypothetical protein